MILPFTLLLLVAGWSARAGELPTTASALAAAVRSYFDEGPAEALAQLEHQAGSMPPRGDVAWWHARCLLDLERPDEALAILGNERGGNIPTWRFDALRAQASVLTGASEGAFEAGLSALGGAGEGEDDAVLRDQTRLLVAALGARSGQDDRALDALRGLPVPPPALDLPPRLLLALPEADTILAAPLAPGARLPEALAFQAAGSWWRVEAGGGLARRIDAPLGPVRECPRPALCTPDGALLLPMAGVRYTPRAAGGVLLYGSGREPLAQDDGGAGIFAWDGTSTAPRRITRPPDGAFDLDPAAGPDGEVLFLRRAGGHTRLQRLDRYGEPETLAPDLDTIGGLAVIGDVAVLAAVLDGRGALRWVPVDAESDEESVPLLELPLELWSPRALTAPGGAAGRW